MLNNILTLSKQLIRIPSTQDNPKAMKTVLNTALKAVGDFNIKRFTKNNSPSSLIYNTKTLILYRKVTKNDCFKL